MTEDIRLLTHLQYVDTIPIYKYATCTDQTSAIKKPTKISYSMEKNFSASVPSTEFPPRELRWSLHRPPNLDNGFHTPTARTG